MCHAVDESLAAFAEPRGSVNRAKLEGFAKTVWPLATLRDSAGSFHPLKLENPLPDAEP